MAVFVVTWNLNREVDYNTARQRFLARLDQFEHIADQSLDSVKWISTVWTAEQVVTFLAEALDNTDGLFVSMVRAGERQGLLPKHVWDWINARQ